MSFIPCSDYSKYNYYVLVISQYTAIMQQGKISKFVATI